MNQKLIQINFERANILVDYDEDIERFVKTLKRDSCNEDDIHVFHAYFQLYWPIKSVILNGVVKNFPQKFYNYVIINKKSLAKV